MHIQPCLLTLYDVAVRTVYSPNRHDGEFGGCSIRTSRVDFNDGIFVFFVFDGKRRMEYV
jgi:hypothetical protein